MASNFAFQAQGASFLLTCVATPTTTSVGLSNAITTGNYPAGCVRIANLGAAVAFLQFGATGAGVSANVTTGIALLGTSVEKFSMRGLPFLSTASAGTTTLNITPGEGL